MAAFAQRSTMAQQHASSQRHQHMPVNNAPPGTFAPGTKVQVGNHRVVIEKYLSEGGFAHVYVVRVPTKDSRYEVAVLKRVAVPDKDALANMRTEVETMKKLQGHTHIVRYIDSHASQLPKGGYEVFLLMEFCSGGGLIDFMNTRLQYRLTEPEILHIFADVAEGVAAMHYLKPPLLHRDLKVENVLITKSATSPSGIMYKLCDFGSTAPPRPAAKDANEARLIEDDIQRHTTVQYRSPEMIDVWRKQPIDEKSDVWALGVLLYKLCYYTTPFEEVGQMAILNARFKFPHHPHFSQKLRGLISAMLMENPQSRPNIYQIIQQVCSMRGTKMPIKDIYSDRSQSESRRNQELPPKLSDIASPPPAVGLTRSPAKQTKDTLPEVVPMRRGRPTTAAKPVAAAEAAQATPVKGDPFAALDSSNMTVRSEAIDDLSKKFPSLEDFSIANDRQKDFTFTPKLSSSTQQNAQESSRTDSKLQSKEEKTSSGAKARPKKPLIDSDSKRIAQTSPIPKPKPLQLPDYSSRPIWRVPERSESQPRPSVENKGNMDKIRLATRSLQPSPRPKPSELEKSLPPPPTESHGNDSARASSRSPDKQHRRTSSGYVNSNLDYLRDHETETAKSPPAMGSRKSSSHRLSALGSPEARRPIDNDTVYLRSLEESDDTWHREQIDVYRSRQRGSDLRKQESLIDLGDQAHKAADGDNLSVVYTYKDRRPLSPVAASEVASTPRRSAFDDGGLEETEDLPPELHAEMERHLRGTTSTSRDAEESTSRVDSNTRKPSRANTIQQRVQALLDGGRASPIPRTAAGYGHYTDVAESAESIEIEDERNQIPVPEKIISPSNNHSGLARPDTIASARPGELNVSKQRQDRNTDLECLQPTVSAPASINMSRIGPRPPSKPKPAGLRTSVVNSEAVAEWQNAASTSSQGSRLAALLAKDQEGVAEAGPGATSRRDTSPYGSNARDATAGRDDLLDMDDLESDFSKRYPSIGGIDLDSATAQRIRIRDV